MSIDIQLPTKPESFSLHPADVAQFQFRRLGSNAIESSSLAGTPLYAGAFCHPVVEAALLAFAHHYSLALRPDDFWLMISQGFALHITQNAEALRSKFVTHKGQLQLTVVRNHFVLGSPDNDWEGVFAEFSQKIGEHIGETQKHFVPNFSTTTATDTAAFEITLLDAMKVYFKYVVVTECGIPTIRLEGEKSDWERVLAHTEELAKIDPSFSWWTDRVILRLTQVIACFDEPNPELWLSFFKESSMSGGSIISGWIIDFFPYLTQWGKTVANSFTGLELDSLPTGLSVAPFTWRYHGTPLEMKFVAGHIGVAFRGDFLRPITGWVIQNTEIQVQDPDQVACTNA